MDQTFLAGDASLIVKRSAYEAYCEAALKGPLHGEPLHVLSAGFLGSIDGAMGVLVDLCDAQLPPIIDEPSLWIVGASLQVGALVVRPHQFSLIEPVAKALSARGLLRCVFSPQQRSLARQWVARHSVLARHSKFAV